jgi:hypothetical protein
MVKFYCLCYIFEAECRVVKATNLQGRDQAVALEVGVPAGAAVAKSGIRFAASSSFFC